QRIISARHHPLAEEDLYPAFFAEQFFVLAEDPPVGAKEIHLSLQGRRRLHCLAIAPKLAVLALGRLEVENDEIADAFVLERRLAIELINIGLIKAAIGKQAHEPDDRRLNEMKRRR